MYVLFNSTTFHVPNTICRPFNKISPRFTVIEIKTAQSKQIGYKVGYMARFVCCNTNRQSVLSEHPAKDTYQTAFLVAYRIACSNGCRAIPRFFSIKIGTLILVVEQPKLLPNFLKRWIHSDPQSEWEYGWAKLVYLMFLV